MIRMINQFATDESGATAIEYAMIAALVSAGLVGASQVLGQSVDGAMTSVSSDLETVAKNIP